MSNWSTSNYRRRKAARQATRPAQWFTNPETQEQFFIRPLGASAIALAGYLPGGLKQDAVEGWKQHGVEAEGDGSSAEVATRSAEEVDRSNRASARLIYEACLIPTLTAIGESVESIQERALKNCDLAFRDDESWKKASEAEKLERAAEVVMPLEDLEDSDARFILAKSYGYAGTVPLQGGQVTNVTDIKSLIKKPGRRPRTGTGG